MSATQRKQAIRHDIMNVIKANNLEVSGDFWLMLIFRTESELKKIAQDFHIRTARPAPGNRRRIRGTV
jgi:hypothetical protein